MNDLSNIVDCCKIVAKRDQLKSDIDQHSRSLYRHLRGEEKAGRLMPIFVDGASKVLATIEQAEISLAEIEKDCNELEILFLTYRSIGELNRSLATEKNKIIISERNLKNAQALHVRDGVEPIAVGSLPDICELALKSDRAKADSSAPDLERRLRRIQEILAKYT